jgi:hypothetical protein
LHPSEDEQEQPRQVEGELTGLILSDAEQRRCRARVHQWEGTKNARRRDSRRNNEDHVDLDVVLGADGQAEALPRCPTLGLPQVPYRHGQHHFERTCKELMLPSPLKEGDEGQLGLLQVRGQEQVMRGSGGGSSSTGSRDAAQGSSSASSTAAGPRQYANI